MLTNDLRHIKNQAHQVLLEADQPLPVQQIARCLFGPSRHELPETQAVVRTLLGSDPRFIETHDFRWSALGAQHVSLPLADASYTVVDLETTGSVIGIDEIMEIGVVVVRRGEVVERFNSLLYSQRDIPPWVSKLTGLTKTDLQGAPVFADIADQLFELIDGSVFVAHDIRFDLPFLRWEFGRRELDIPRVTGLCTLRLSRLIWPDLESRSLPDLARHFEVVHTDPHRAADDAEATARILQLALIRAKEIGLTRLSDVFSSTDERQLPLAAKAAQS